LFLLDSGPRCASVADRDLRFELYQRLYNLRIAPWNGIRSVGQAFQPDGAPAESKALPSGLKPDLHLKSLTYKE
jgi:hypothetical protein